MKIGSVRIRNFRSIESLDLPLAPVTLITGPNGSGKSSFQGALDFLVSGRAPWTNDRGQGLSELVRDGAELAEVTFVAPEGDDSITRSIPHALTMSGAPSQMSLAEAQRRLDELIGCSGEWARLSLRAGRYFGLEEKDQKAVLYDLLGLHITDELVQKELAAKEERCGLPLQKLAKKVLQGSVSANFGRCHDRFYTARTQINKSIKSAQELLKAELAKEKDEKVACIQPPPADEVQRVQEDLAAVQTAVARREGATKEVRRAEAEVSRLKAEVARLAADVERRPVVSRSAEELKEAEALLDEILEQRKAAKEHQEGRERARSRGRELKAELEALEASLEGRGGCPLRADHPCRPAADVLKAQRPTMIERHKQLLANIEALIPAATSEDVAPLIQAHEERIAKGQAFLAEQRQARQQAEAWSNKEGQLHAKREELAQAEKRLAELLAELDAHPTPETLETQRKEVIARKAALDEKSQWAREWSEHVGALNAHRDQIASGEGTRTVLNELIHFFGKEGMQRDVLLAKIEPIQAELNGILDRWGMACAYEIPTADLKVRPRPTSPFLPYSRLSDAEQIMVALAHQIVFGVITRFRIATLDRFEALDKQHQELLLRAALDTQDLLDHLIILGVSSQATPPAGIATYDLSSLRQEAASREA